MGRTGRKRAGKVVLLLMEGRELSMFKNSIAKNEKLRKDLK